MVVLVERKVFLPLSRKKARAPLSPQLFTFVADGLNMMRIRSQEGGLLIQGLGEDRGFIGSWIGFLFVSRGIIGRGKETSGPSKSKTDVCD